MEIEKISWHTPEYLHTEKTTDWYWIVGIVSVSIALLAIIFCNIIFAIFIIVASFTLSLFASREPEIIEVVIDSYGVKIHNIQYPYKNLESFWVETREIRPKVVLKSKKVLMPYITILIHDANPEDIKTVLSRYLPEHEHTEPLLEKLLIYLGF